MTRDMKRQDKSESEESICPVSAQSPRLGISRSHVSYWSDRVEKVRAKSGTESPHFSARIVFKNRRVRFPLHTPNRKAAASKAAKIYTHLVEHGWEETLAAFKPESLPSHKPEPSAPDTVGELIRVAKSYSTAREQSFAAYSRALRKIVAEIEGIGDGRKHDTRDHNGNQKWRESVDAVKLAVITPERVQAWKLKRINAPGRDASAKRKAIVTVNSLIRNAKALFAKRLLPFISKEVELPCPLPFDGIGSERSPSLRYQSQINPGELMTKSVKLLDTNREAYKCFLLAFVCGLRVSEIDYLLWTAFDFDAHVLRIRHTQFHQLKSEDSAGDINLDDGFSRLFQEFAKDASSEFVIESQGAPRRAPGSGSYRCQFQLDALKKWLRDNGIRSQKPIHTLRKEVGAILASEKGIYAASRYLRHSDIRITSAFYADQKLKVIPSIANFHSQTSG